ncbi:MAG: hypothetical protein K2K44_02450 [Oscillospiraceae bacterium]|nr:hypothetical protein [Oscillospiraceae bacterium]
MLKYYIMKKLFFAFIFIFASVLLSGCKTERTRTVMFTENPPPLTTMTMTTVSNADTFSEYMATYSAPETTAESSRGNSNTVSRPPRVAPDTGFDRGGIEQVSRDTAAVFTYVVTDEVSSYTGSSETTAVTEVPESETESTTTSVVETTAETERSTVSTVSAVKVPLDTAFRERPKRDTAFSQHIPADTVYSSSSLTENGGNTNADKHTE